jgi:hypothetical protein
MYSVLVVNVEVMYVQSPQILVGIECKINDQKRSKEEVCRTVN